MTASQFAQFAAVTGGAFAFLGLLLAFGGGIGFAAAVKVLRRIERAERRLGHQQTDNLRGAPAAQGTSSGGVEGPSPARLGLVDHAQSPR